MLTLIINGIIELLYIIVVAVTYILPDTPFDFSNLSWGPFGRAVGYFFPVAQMGVHMTVLLSAFLVYYGVRWILRIIKTIR